MINVLFIDRNDPHIIEWIKGLAGFVRGSNIKIFCISDKEASIKKKNFEIVNVNDVPQNLKITELQNTYGFSIFKALVVERSFFDYTSFRKYQRYSNLSLDQIEEIISPFLNAYDFVIREKIDLVIDSLADNFLTSIAEKIADHYNVPMIEKFLYYWWSDGFLPVNRKNQTSSILDSNYEYFYSNPQKIDKEKIIQIFENQIIDWQYESPSPIKTILKRFKLIRNRNKSYEPFSLKNWTVRRVCWAWSKFLYNVSIKKHLFPVEHERFLYFPLHVCPEAVLLGSKPELAEQFALIKNISMNLPWGMKLYVKDHPAQQVGLSLDYNFYKRLESLPNVRYFPPQVNSELLFESPQCKAVAVINGTVGLEAAMKRKLPVYVFGNAVYKQAKCFIKPLTIDEFSSHLLDVVEKDKYQFDHLALDAMLMALTETVFRGSVDFTQFKTWEERSYASFALHKDFIESRVWENKK